MAWEDILKALATQCGIATAYWNIQGVYIQVPLETIVICLEAIGFKDLSLKGLQESLEERKKKSDELSFSIHVLRKHKKKLRLPQNIGPGEAFVLDERGEVLSSLPFEPPILEVTLPQDAPWGYYTLLLFPKRTHEVSSLLIFSPCEAYLEDGKTWGIHGALSALVTERSQGIGDLKDLEEIQNAVVESGGKFFGILPLHLTAKKMPEGISPYLPLSRMLFDPIYLPLEEVLALFPEASLSIPHILRKDLIDYEEVWRVKDSFLRKTFQVFWEKRDTSLALLWSEFQEFVSKEKDWLFPSSLYQAIALEKGLDWREWPTSLQKRDTNALTSFAKDHEYEVSYFAFLQWLIHRLLKKVTAQHRILCFDLPIGCAPSGVESWLAQDKLVFSCTVGAPPDDFSPEGQNWGFHPFSPLRIRETRYIDFIALLRFNMRFARFLRLDHIMGLKRLFWIPVGKSASLGTYVEYPFRELLAILTLESIRNKVILIGEDLGTVPRFLRSVLRRSSILSTRVFYFERDGHMPRPPEKYPRKSYATLNTHDMPPLQAFLEGKDISTRVALGTLSLEEASSLLMDRREFIAMCFEKLREWGFLKGDNLFFALLRFLAAVPSLVVSISIDDLLESTSQFNLPGTVGEYPNWRHWLALDLKDFKGRLLQVARLFRPERGNSNDQEGL